MTAVPPFKVVRENESTDDAETIDFRAHYETAAHDLFRLLWRRKWLISAAVVVSLVAATAGLARMGPRYTSEAIVQFNFSETDATHGPRSVAVEASALVDSATRIISARATADAVVTRLGLDRNPQFQRQPALSHLMSMIREALGLQGRKPSPHDRAIAAVMKQVRVTNDRRSYIISISATSPSPDEAARLANAVSAEYLRTLALQDVMDARAAAETSLAEATLVYGLRHPSYLSARRRLEQLQGRLTAMLDMTTEDAISRMPSGQMLIAARPVYTPSGPNVPFVLGLSGASGFGFGVLLAWITARPNRIGRV